MGKFHETKQQKQLLLSDELGFQVLADIQDDHFLVNVKVLIIIDALNFIKKAHVFLIGSYAEMAG